MNEESRAAWTKVLVAVLVVISIGALVKCFLNAEFGAGFFGGIAASNLWVRVAKRLCLPKE